MIPKDFKVQTPEKSSFEVLPEDTYQVEIEDIELKTDQPVYQSEEVEDRFSFKFRVVEEGEHNGRYLWLDVRPIMSAGGTGMNASWLYKIYSAVNQVKLTDEQAKSVGGDQVNDMVGKQLRVIVKQKPKQNGELRNKITDVLPLKTKLAPKVDPGEIVIESEDLPF